MKYDVNMFQVKEFHNMKRHYTLRERYGPKIRPESCTDSPTDSRAPAILPEIKFAEVLYKGTIILLGLMSFWTSSSHDFYYKFLSHVPLMKLDPSCTHTRI
jgi:hypothetical protein